MSITVAVPKETFPGESRVAVTPAAVAMLVKNKFSVVIEEGAGVAAGYTDASYVAKGARISGSPAFAANEWLRAITALQKLPELLRTVRELKRKVDELEQNVEANSTP